MTFQRLAIINALVFDGSSSELSEHPIHIDNGVIVSHSGSPAAGAQILDVRGKVVAPGLIDAHFHAYAACLDLSELEALPTSYVTAHASQRLRRALQRGFTTVRDVAGGDLGLVRALNEGILVGPRYLFTGRGLTQTGGHGDPRPGGVGLCCESGHMAEVVDGVDSVRRTVRERFRAGAHAIKVFASGGVVSPTDPLRLAQYSNDELSAICDEAARRESYVAAHAYSPDAIRRAIGAGVRTIEHGNFIDSPTAVFMAEHEAFLVPTTIAYDAMLRRGADFELSRVSRDKNKEVLEAGLESLETARSAGVRLGFGTDLMGPLEDEQLGEFRLRVDIDGVVELLRSATSINAEIIQRSDLGSTDVGTAADLIVFDGNPLDRPDLLWSASRTVIQAGKVMAS